MLMLMMKNPPPIPDGRHTELTSTKLILRADSKLVNCIGEEILVTQRTSQYESQYVCTVIISKLPYLPLLSSRRTHPCLSWTSWDPGKPRFQKDLILSPAEPCSTAQYITRWWGRSSKIQKKLILINIPAGLGRRCSPPAPSTWPWEWLEWVPRCKVEGAWLEKEHSCE